jgi:two-component SAPR family response regulator/nucleoid-associated protein YgaU
MWTSIIWAVTRLASAVGLLGLVAGIPVGQARYIGWPLPSRLPTGEQLRAALTSRDWLTDATLVNGLSVLLWLLWLLFVISVMVEVAASVRGVRAPRYRLLAPTQGLAAALVAGLTATIVATAPAPALTHAPLTVAPHPSDRPAAVVVVPAPSTPAATTRVDAVALKPVGTITVLINGQPHQHTVVKGESLWRIAETYLGDANRWPEIWDLNKGKYWPHVSGRTTFHDPDLIFPGWVLSLPADATAPPETDLVDPPPQPAPPGPSTPPVTVVPTPSATPATPSPAPSITGPAGAVPTAPATPGHSATATTNPATTPIPTPTAVGSSAPADDPALAAMPGWIQIAGGFIGVGFAVGLLYAAALVWKRRRHRYRPTPISSPVLDDPDLAPPLGALTHLRQSVRRQAPHLLEPEPDRGPTVREYTSAEVKPPLPPVGPAGADLAGVAALPVGAGLGLRGPAALDAARALLVATLTSGRADDPDARGQAIVPAATLATLLGVSAVDLPAMHRLTVAASFADALTLVEEEIIRRSRIIADHDVADIASLREAQALAEPLPQLLLIADVPDEVWHARVSTAIRLGTAVEIGTALIGDWPHGTTLTVAGDGATTGGDEVQRVAVLDTTATSQMLAMLAEAHGDAAPPTLDRDTPAAPTPTPTPNTPAESTADADAVVVAPAASADIPDATSALKPRIVDVRVLGTPAIVGADGAPVRGLRAKSLELLVYLAVHRRGSSLDDIMEAIWGDAKPRRAGERLSTCVGNLRGVIRAVALPGEKPKDATPNGRKRAQIEPVVNTGSHYHLDPAIVHIDWWTILDEYTQVAAATDDPARLAHLQVAIGHIRGGLADGEEYEWVETDREHVRRHIIKIYAQAATLLAETDPRLARVYSDQACDLDPLSDELARRAMQAAAHVGDADAIRHRLATLRRELDNASIELDPDTEQFAASLLRDLANP